MIRIKRWVSAMAVLLGVLMVALPAYGEASPLKSPATGSPKVQSIDVISFGPQGLLLIGDGRGAQFVAVETGDTAAKPPMKSHLDQIDEKLAGRLGTTAKGIEILDMAVNPASATIYFALRRQDNKSHVILTVDGTGKIGELVLENVKYARLPLASGESAAIDKVTDVAWAGDRVLVAGRANEAFSSKMLVIPTPVEHEGKATAVSAETYHVSHGRWETKAPMSTLMPFEDKGMKYLVGSFSCTPVVKYPLDDIKSGAKIKGISVIELGSGNQPLDMFSYEKNGRSYVLMNTFRFHHKAKPFGPSPYWTARFDLDLLRETEKVNEKAPRRLDAKGAPVSDHIKLIEEFHGVVHMDRLGKDHAVVLRKNGDQGGYSLAVLALP